MWTGTNTLIVSNMAEAILSGDDVLPFVETLQSLYDGNVHKSGRIPLNNFHIALVQGKWAFCAGVLHDLNKDLKHFLLNSTICHDQMDSVTEYATKVSGCAEAEGVENFISSNASIPGRLIYTVPPWAKVELILTLAAFNGKPEFLDLLLSHGASIHMVSFKQSMATVQTIK